MIHQIGPDQEGFFGFYEQQVLPTLGVAPELTTADAPALDEGGPPYAGRTVLHSVAV